MSSTPLSIVVVIMIVFVYFVFVSVSSCLDHRPYTHLVGGKVDCPCFSVVCAFVFVLSLVAFWQSTIHMDCIFGWLQGNTGRLVVLGTEQVDL